MTVPTAIVPTTTKTVALSSTTAGTTATGTDSKDITTTTSATTRSSTLLSSTTTKKISGGNGSKCFPADATVELESGAMVRMDALAIGDSVKVGVNQYSRVFMFTHKSSSVVSQFVTLKTSSGASLALTKGHYIYVNGALAAASTVAVGDELTLGNGETSAVTTVGSITGAGLFNPQTVNGNVVVNGVVSSTYTIAVEPNFAHAILAPFRLLNNFGFSFTALESGGGLLAAAAPRGARTL
jgi:Hint module